MLNAAGRASPCAPRRRRSAGWGARSSLGAAAVQPERDLDARKAKKNQGKILAFPWISLVELGLFKGLRRSQIKNPEASQLASRVARQAIRRTSSWLPRFAPPVAPRRGMDLAPHRPRPARQGGSRPSLSDARGPRPP